VKNPPEENSNPVPDVGDGTLDQSTIDASLGNESDGSGAPSADATGDANAPAASDQRFSQEDIDALLSAAGATLNAEPEAESDSSVETATTAASDSRGDTLDRPFDKADAAMQSSLEGEQRAGGAPSSASEGHVSGRGGAAAASTVSTPGLHAEALELTSFGDGPQPDVDPKRLSMLNDVKLRVKIELGRAQMLVEEVLKLGEGSVVELDKLAGDPVDVWVNERLIARGEVLVLNDNFCVRISEVFSNDPHRVTV
jgi:flagellar motor switch protein FliN/FliY